MKLRRGFAITPLLKTGQITVYRAADDGDYEIGLAKAYMVYDVGGFAGTVNLDVPHYAAATISFTAAGSIIADSANGLATILTGDTIVVKGSANNDGVYTVTAGGVAGSFVVAEALVDEAVGRYVSLYKRAAHSNNCVLDRRTGLMWSRYTSSGEKIGPASNGQLVWYDAALCFTLHPAAADLQMIAAINTLRIVGGAAEVTRYHVGDPIVCTGFVNAVNNLPGYKILSVTVNGADLDIVLKVFNNTLISEAAAGSRSIKLICRGIFSYAAAANAVNLGGYTDWRVPNVFELFSLVNYEVPSAVPDATAFPGWPALEIWTSSTRPSGTTAAPRVHFNHGYIDMGTKDTSTICCALVRGDRFFNRLIEM